MNDQFFFPVAYLYKYSSKSYLTNIYIYAIIFCHQRLPCLEELCMHLDTNIYIHICIYCKDVLEVKAEEIVVCKTLSMIRVCIQHKQIFINIP